MASGKMSTAETRSPKPTRGAELKLVLEAERGGLPFVTWRNDEGALCVRPLELGPRSLTIGRNPSCDVILRGDTKVSRVHAELISVGDEVVVEDDGLSRNGTWLDGERIKGRVRLRDRCTLRCGSTLIEFRDPRAAADAVPTSTALDGPGPAALSAGQAQVAQALIDLTDAAAAGRAAPPSNRELADHLHVSVDAVKTQMRALFTKFGISHLAQNEKRASLVQLLQERGYRAG